jgi:hypothetical protein
MPTTTTTTTTRPRGFALAGHASAAARKGHALGRAYCHEWTADQAIAAGLKAARGRRLASAWRRAGRPA